MLEIKDFGMFGQGRTFEVNVRFGRTEQFGLKMAELFGRTECSFEHYGLYTFLMILKRVLTLGKNSLIE